ncbi:sigma-70 family RNA polymerase sigma factor [Lysinibacillus sp. LZ02]|uniref:sigma-70 family RNA polymerase sigma factor n=1 Tax=Lysinibacillus sp. LZ02 TaxID=3420668 RepID=UPI003D363595
MTKELQEAMQMYGEYCMRVAYLYVKDWTAAEEVVPDVFLAYYRQKDCFRQASSLKTYLVKITVHKSHDYLRSWRAKKRQLIAPFQMKTKEQSIEQQAIKQDERRILVDALLKLPMKYREVLILHYYDDYRLREIADILGVSENTVKTRVSRGREKLKDLLQQEQWEVLLHD